MKRHLFLLLASSLVIAGFAAPLSALAYYPYQMQYRQPTYRYYPQPAYYYPQTTYYYYYPPPVTYYYQQPVYYYPQYTYTYPVAYSPIY